MGIDNLKITTRRSWKDLRIIYSAMFARFGDLMHQTYQVTYGFKNNMPLTFGKEPILRTKELVGIIAKYKLEKNERTLRIFEAVIRTVNEFESIKIERPEIPYEYKTDLKKLLHGYLQKNNPAAIADPLSRPIEFDAALEILREIGAMIRVYKSPLFSVIGKCPSWTRLDVERLTDEWFKGSIGEAMNAGVRLAFRGRTIADCQELAKIIYDDDLSRGNLYHLSHDGRTLRLFQKAICAASNMPKSAEGAASPTLDLWWLMPRKLKENKIAKKEIEDMIDCKYDFTVFQFLRRVNAVKGSGLY